jgi:nucleotide-binding universal stress UspA family protein
MTKRSILLATDFSARCDRALDRAARLAGVTAAMGS